MGRGFVGHVCWREETPDHQAGLWVWKSSYGSHSGGIYVEYDSFKLERMKEVSWLTLPVQSSRLSLWASRVSKRMNYRRLISLIGVLFNYEKL